MVRKIEEENGKKGFSLSTLNQTMIHSNLFVIDSNLFDFKRVKFYFDLMLNSSGKVVTSVREAMCSLPCDTYYKYFWKKNTLIKFYSQHYL